MDTTTTTGTQVCRAIGKRRLMTWSLLLSQLYVESRPRFSIVATYYQTLASSDTEPLFSNKKGKMPSIQENLPTFFAK